MLEASGEQAALGNVLRATARGGTLVQVGNLPGAPVSAVLGDNLVTRENSLGRARTGSIEEMSKVAGWGSATASTWRR